MGGWTRTGAMDSVGGTFSSNIHSASKVKVQRYLQFHMPNPFSLEFSPSENILIF